MGRDVQTGAGDDRVDQPQRDRIDELVESWHAAVARLDARYWKVTVLSLIAVTVACVAVGSTVWLLKRTDEEAAKNTAALCALRHDIEGRIVRNTARLRRSEEFLRDNPAGVLGIPARMIRDGVNEQRNEIEDQKKTVEALAGVDCSA